MKKNTKEIRFYTFADSVNISEARRIAACATRDFDDLEARVVTEDEIADILDTADEFEALPDSEEVETDSKEETNIKNVILGRVDSHVGTLRNMFALEFKNDKTKYDSAGFDGFGKLLEDAIPRGALRVWRRATKYRVQLIAHQGLTQALLDAFAAEIAGLSAAFIAMDMANEDGSEKTQERVALGNVLYTKYLRIASIGKNVYFENNEAKHNDYVIYDTVKHAQTTGNAALDQKKQLYLTVTTGMQTLSGHVDSSGCVLYFGNLITDAVPAFAGVISLLSTPTFNTGDIGYDAVLRPNLFIWNNGVMDTVYIIRVV